MKPFPRSQMLSQPHQGSMHADFLGWTVKRERSTKTWLDPGLPAEAAGIEPLPSTIIPRPEKIP